MPRYENHIGVTLYDHVLCVLLGFALHMLTSLRQFFSGVCDLQPIGSISHSRHWMPDSSPQGSWNFLINVEFRLQFPKHMSSEQFATFVLPAKDSTFNLLPFVTLGYGFSGAVNKAHQWR